MRLSPVQRSVVILEQLRAVLVERRREGSSFEEAWGEAAAVAVRMLLMGERRAWREALEETAGSWECAYLNVPDVMAARVADLEAVCLRR